MRNNNLSPHLSAMRRKGCPDRIYQTCARSSYTHTPGAVDTHTHTPGAVDTHTHTHTPGAVDTYTHTHLEQWTPFTQEKLQHDHRM